MKGTAETTVARANVAARQNVERNKEVILKSYALFTDFISEINNKLEDKEKDLDVVIPMHNLIEHTYKYFKNLEVYVSITEISQMLPEQILNNSNSLLD